MFSHSHRIPVYILNALYLAPLTLWTYLKYGRPPAPGSQPQPSPHQNASEDMKEMSESPPQEQHHHSNDHLPETDPENKHEPEHDMSSHAHMNHGMTDDRPMFATITVAVCHCGAGCLLGDIVGEWLVYGAGITINGRDLWAEYLIGRSSLLYIECIHVH